MGQPEWHPPGQYMVFQAQKPSGQGHWGRGLAATPGFGRHSDLWLMELATRCSFRLTDMPEDDRSGVLHPHFSHDGSKLIWSEMHAAPNAVHGFGQWKIKVAGFALKEGVPVLPDVHSHVPGKAGWYENHGLSRDNRTRLFTSCFDSNKAFRANVYHHATDQARLDLRGGAINFVGRQPNLGPSPS